MTLPFGKYKGQEIEELLVDDPDYLEWLMEQDWFTEKFPKLAEEIELGL